MQMETPQYFKWFSMGKRLIPGIFLLLEIKGHQEHLHITLAEFGRIFLHCRDPSISSVDIDSSFTEFLNYLNLEDVGPLEIPE